MGVYQLIFGNKQPVISSNDEPVNFFSKNKQKLVDTKSGCWAPHGIRMREPSIYRCHSLPILRDGHGHRRIYGTFPLADSTKKLRQYLKMFSDATTWWNTAPTNPQRFVSTVQTEGLNTKKTRRCYSKNPRYMMKRRQIIYKARSKNPKT